MTQVLQFHRICRNNDILTLPLKLPCKALTQELTTQSNNLNNPEYHICTTFRQKTLKESYL